MNKAALIGRLTKEPVIKYTQEQMCVARFTLAVNRAKKGEADFIGCVAFGKTAEVVERYTNKGSQVGIEGHIQTGSYTNKDGAKVYTTDVIVDRLDLLGSKNEQSNEPAESGFMDIPEGIENDLPFN